jgi:hypothetical protein
MVLILARIFGPFGAFHEDGEAGSFWHPASVKRADKVCQNNQIRMGIGNENDQALKGHSVDALACTGDEGRDTLR